MIKTYALFDVIAVKDALKAGTAGTILSAFWEAVDIWTNEGGQYALNHVRVLGQNAYQSPNPFVVTYSDSALMHMGTEIELDDFYALVLDLKMRIERSAGKCYVIINRDEDIAHHDTPVLGGRLMGSDLMPRYYHIGGSGPAFVNLYCADEVLRGHKAWHDKYSVYCIGKQSCKSSITPMERTTFKGSEGSEHELLVVE